MADDDKQEEEKPKSNMMLIIIVALVAVLLGGGIAAFFLMSGGDEPSTAAAEDNEPTSRPAIYFEIKPPFVVNYEWQGRRRYVQISVAIMARKDKVIEAVQKHMPLVKSRLVDIFSAQNFDGLKTEEGKEAMRSAALEELQKIVNDELGEPGVENLFFTNFVMQ